MSNSESRAKRFVQVVLGVSMGILGVSGLLVLLSGEASAEPLLQETSNLFITVTHTPVLFSPGKPMTYSITYGKEGFGVAEDVVMTTTLPAATSYVGHGWTTADGRVYTYAVGDLSAGTTSFPAWFVVSHTNRTQISVPEFDTSFLIAGAGGIEQETNPEDNAARVRIGVPDLRVTDFAVEPYPPQADIPVTFTVVMENQGTATAQNPMSPGGGSFVGIFLGPVASYPVERNGDILDFIPAISAGALYTHVVTETSPYEGGARIRFSAEQIQAIEEFYVRVDSTTQNPYGLVPEYDEFNNLATLDTKPWDIFLPLVAKAGP